VTVSRSTTEISLRRTVTVPDTIRLARHRRVPELGPRVLFFSGGTALNPLSRRLVDYTHNSIHVVTPFDSGGSSREIREAFHMLSVGDLRSRLMALADQSVRGNPEIYALFAYRLDPEAARRDLVETLKAMVKGDHPLVAAVHDPMRKIIRNHLRMFLEALPDSFDLRGASVGNLILTGGFLNNQRHIDPVIFMFAKLVEARGTVRPVANEYLHLVAELEDGTRIMGQRALTGKETTPISSPVARLYISDDSSTGRPVTLEIRTKLRELIRRADLIVFPMGSFYSSLLANLLPDGIVDEIAANPCPKVYVPNTGTDPEQTGLTTADCVNRLIGTLSERSNGAALERLLNFVVVDSGSDAYRHTVAPEAIRATGVELIDTPLITSESYPGIDSDRLIAILLSIA